MHAIAAAARIFRSVNEDAASSAASAPPSRYDIASRRRIVPIDRYAGGPRRAPAVEPGLPQAEGEGAREGARGADGGGGALTAQAEETAAEFSQKRERLQTDFDNFKARHYNQTRDAQIDAKIKLVKDFLPVLDNFDRARTSLSPDGATPEATNAEYQEVHARLMATLGELGMEKIEAVGTEFDYNLHMAIQQQPSDEYDEGVVCAEMQPGYTLGGKLLRAAYVMVSAGARERQTHDSD